jgi:hypothetical protein
MCQAMYYLLERCFLRHRGMIGHKYHVHVIVQKGRNLSSLNSLIGKTHIHIYSEMSATVRRVNTNRCLTIS